MRTLALPPVVAGLERRLASLGVESARRWGRMTAHEMLCHLADSFEVALAVRTVKGADSALTRTVLKWLALWVPVHWPHGVPTRPETDPRRAGTRPADFTADRDRVVALMRRLPASPVRHFGPHPLFATMSRREWMRWGYLHVDHHLRQFGA
jgi:hypothetical protein